MEKSDYITVKFVRSNRLTLRQEMELAAYEQFHYGTPGKEPVGLPMDKPAEEDMMEFSYSKPGETKETCQIGYHFANIIKYETFLALQDNGSYLRTLHLRVEPMKELNDYLGETVILNGSHYFTIRAIGHNAEYTLLIGETRPLHTLDDK